MPDEALTCRLHLDIMRAVVNRQVQGVHTGTTIRIGISIRISTRCLIGRTVPDKALAHRLRLRIVRAVMDRQVQGVHAGATICIGIGVCINT